MLSIVEKIKKYQHLLKDWIEGGGGEWGGEGVKGNENNYTAYYTSIGSFQHASFLPHQISLVIRQFENNAAWKNIINILFALGWVDFGLFLTFSTKVPLGFVTYLPKVPKIAKQIVLTQSALHRCSQLFGSFWHYQRVQKFFSSKDGLHGYRKTQNFT
jgi:hypothetical protein